MLVANLLSGPFSGLFLGPFLMLLNRPLHSAPLMEQHFATWYPPGMADFSRRSPCLVEVGGRKGPRGTSHSTPGIPSDLVMHTLFTGWITIIILRDDIAWWGGVSRVAIQLTFKISGKN